MSSSPEDFPQHEPAAEASAADDVTPLAADRLTAFLLTDQGIEEEGLILALPLHATLAISRFVTREVDEHNTIRLERHQQPFPTFSPSTIDRTIRDWIPVRAAEVQPRQKALWQQGIQYERLYGNRFPQIIVARRLSDQLRQTKSPLHPPAESLVAVLSICAEQHARALARVSLVQGIHTKRGY